MSFIIGVLVGGFIMYLFWQNKQKEAQQRESALRRQLTEAENEARRLSSQQDRSVTPQDDQLKPSQAALETKTQELQQKTEQLAAAEAQIATLREQLARAEAAPEPEAKVETAAEASTGSGTPEVVEEEAKPVQPDDLKKIEGIGPKAAQVLNEKGILSFADLAGTEVSALRAILEEAGPGFKRMEPESWPEQAGLAAKGDWEALQRLQDTLDGGRYRTE